MSNPLSTSSASLLVKIISCWIMMCFAELPHLSGQCITGNCSWGKGTYLFKDGSAYGGSFQNNFPHGYGKIKYKNGNVYEGYWVHGKKSGKGIFTFKQGHVFSGQFEADGISGTGNMRYRNGDQYSGDWKQNKPEGKGTYLYGNGEKYEGDFDSGQFHGKGIFVAKDGSYFLGNYAYGKKNGQGKLVMPDGSSFLQEYRDNILVWQQKLPLEESGRPNAEAPINCNEVYCHDVSGYYTYGDGSRYEGRFDGGKGSGNGKCTYANGDTYVGEWADHAPHGQGTLVSTDGQKISGSWNKGQFVKKREEELKVQKTSGSGSSDQSNVVSPKIYALIVGVAMYHHSKSLKYTDDDAYRIYAFLKSPEGGALQDDRIILLIDEAATRKSVLAAMDVMVGKAGPNDILFVYLSGHGLPGTFVPHDFDGKNNLIAYQELFERMETSSVKHKIFIADACHSGSMITAAKTPLDDQLSLFYDRFNLVKSSGAFISSSKSEEVSLEHGGMRQGIFSHFLIRGLKGEANTNQDAFITVQELYNYIFREVKKYTSGAQTPTISGNYDPNMPVALVRKKV